MKLGRNFVKEIHGKNIVGFKNISKENDFPTSLMNVGIEIVVVEFNVVKNICTYLYVFVCVYYSLKYIPG